MCDNDFECCYRESYVKGFQDGLATGKQLAEEGRSEEALKETREWFKLLLSNLSSINKKERALVPETREHEEMYYDEKR